MRNTLFVLLMAGCGTSSPLTWEKCEGCAADSSTMWNVIADGAEISGDYDVVGPPDPYLCATIDHSTKCSNEVSDSSMPRWDYTLFRSQAATTLIGKTIEIDLWDVDTGGLDTNDAICSTQIQLTDADLEAGGIRFDCRNSVAALRFHAVR